MRFSLVCSLFSIACAGNLSSTWCLRQVTKLRVPPEPLSKASICKAGKSASITALRMNVSPTFVLALFDHGWSSSVDFLAGGGRLNGHEEMTLAVNLLFRKRPGCRVIDVGMNAGFYTWQAASLGCEVDAFDILPRAHMLANLTRVLNEAAVAARVRPHWLAIENASRTVGIGGDIRSDAQAGTFTGGTYITSSAGAPGGVRVPSVRLDDFFGSSMARRHQYSLLKVDVEGFELDVLFSAERLIRMNAISNVIVEIGGKARWTRAGRSSADARRLLDLFDESGFQCRALRMWHSPTKDIITPGHAKFDTALASWPVGLPMSRAMVQQWCGAAVCRRS